MKLLAVYAPAIMFVAACVLLAVWDAPVTYLTELLNGSVIVGYIVYTVLLIIAVVFMPVTVMPLIPMAAAVLGPFATSVLSIVGWTVGAVIAFMAARHIGRPVLERFISLETVDSVVAKIPQGKRFVYIVILRITLPVDVVSYALGFTAGVSLREFTLATIIGVSWFSFAFAYLGEALLEKNVSLLLSLGGVSLVIFSVGWYVLRHTRSDSNTSSTT